VDFELRGVEGRVADILYSAKAQPVAPEIESEIRLWSRKWFEGIICKSSERLFYG
jgi:hypothetical protein